jgi:hypothetical protein
VAPRPLKTEGKQFMDNECFQALNDGYRVRPDVETTRRGRPNRGSRREYRTACERAGKGSKNIERCVISTFRNPAAGNIDEQRLSRFDLLLIAC